LLDPRFERPIGAKRVLLTHLGRDVRERTEALLGEASAVVGAPPLGFADDGLVLEVAP
jgi:ribonuclease BN (tRNA processing enzyme)